MKGNVLYISGWLLAVASGFGLEYTSAASGKKPASAGTLLAAEAGRVVRVLDGDTYEVLTGGQPVRVRLRGVDAPELSQPFGREAADSVTRLLRGQQVWLTRQGIDLYGRTLGGLRVVTPARPGGAALDSLLVVLPQRGPLGVGLGPDAPGSGPRGRAGQCPAGQPGALKMRRGWRSTPACVAGLQSRNKAALPGWLHLVDGAADESSRVYFLTSFFTAMAQQTGILGVKGTVGGLVFAKDGSVRQK